MTINQIIKNYVIELLHRYKDTWIKGKDIVNDWNATFNNDQISQAELRVIIAELRLEGHRIIAGNLGYMLTDDLKLISKYLKSRWCEVCREMKSFRAMAYSCNMIDQLKLWEKEQENETNL